MKITSLIIFGLLFSVMSFGQIITIQGGISNSTLFGEIWQSDYPLPKDNKALKGYSVLVGVDYFDKKHINFSSNIGMIRKGGTFKYLFFNPDGQLTGESYTVKPTLDYLTINTTIDLKFKIKNIIIPFISFGPRFDILLKSSKEFDELKENNQLKYIAAGFILGGGMKFNVSKFQLGVRADYYQDFTKVAVNTGSITGIKSDMLVDTYTINLLLGYRF